jgi:hypothetical protein
MDFFATEVTEKPEGDRLLYFAFMGCERFKLDMNCFKSGIILFLYLCIPCDLCGSYSLPSDLLTRRLFLHDRSQGLIQLAARR